jgi:predicted nucleotidyltransferase
VSRGLRPTRTGTRSPATRDRRTRPAHRDTPAPRQTPPREWLWPPEEVEGHFGRPQSVYRQAPEAPVPVSVEGSPAFLGVPGPPHRAGAPAIILTVNDGLRPSDVLTDDKRAAMRRVFAAYGAEDVRIFGSVARGTDRPGSDLDLLARFPPGFSLFQLMALEADVEEVLGVPVDVVSDHGESPTLQRARAEAVLL